MRYELLIEIIDIVKPKNICEIGVHQGIRATQMCRKALAHNPNSFNYEGYDLWEDLKDEKEVFHGKGPSSKKNVENNLRTIVGFSNYKLIQGDTEKTLPNKSFDLVFLDGDHRDFAIQRDYERVKNSETIIFDDHYTPEINGLGCNKVLIKDHECFLSKKKDTFGPNAFFEVKTDVSFLIATKNKELIDHLKNNSYQEL